jgi:hypothetical protein
VQFCTIDAPYYDTSACFGDSGGPLLADDLVGQPGSPTEIGIASRVGDDTCSTSRPDIFTRADLIASWADCWTAALQPPPTATTLGSISVAPTSARISGRLNAHDSTTTYRFEFGTGAAYTGSTAVANGGSASTGLDVTADLTGLSAGTSYHYRLVATNRAGVTNGADSTFTTPNAPLGGTYAGTTSQGWPIMLRIAPTRETINKLSFSFGLSCTRQHQHPSYNIVAIGARNTVEP